MRRQRLVIAAMLALAAFAWLPAHAENYQILNESLDANHYGYTVLRVWGSHREMGRAIGRAFAQELTDFTPQLRAFPSYDSIRNLVGSAAWPSEMEDEIAGMVEGVKAGVPSSGLDALDLKALNAFSDWGYGIACRSHSSWGHFVQAPVKTISTRRLDFETPFSLALHHVVVAFEPDDGSVRWVNLAWPGFVSVVTGVNEHGTVVSLHDFNSTMVAGSGVTFRSVAARQALTTPRSATLGDQRDEAQNILGNMRVATGTFINYFAPSGEGGVFTCAPGSPCGAARRPQSDYFGGDVLITANSQTDGRSVPGGAEFIDAYYRQGGVKDLASHFGLMGSTGLHLLSVAYRDESDMTLWVNGRGRSDRLELEWSGLFSAATNSTGHADAGTSQPVDGSTPPSSTSDSGTTGTTDSGTTGTTTLPQPPATSGDAVAVGPDASPASTGDSGDSGDTASPSPSTGSRTTTGTPTTGTVGTGCSTSGAPLVALACATPVAVAFHRRRHR